MKMLTFALVLFCSVAHAQMKEISKSDSFVSVKGRFSSVDTTNPLVGEPIDAIECDKTRHECIDATYSKVYGDVDIFHYEITKWTRDEIVAENPARCQTNQLIIRLRDNSVTDLQIPTNDKQCAIVGGAKRKPTTNLMKADESTNCVGEKSCTTGR